MNLQPIIDAINGRPIEVSSGVSVSVSCPEALSLAVHLVGEEVVITLLEPLMAISVGAASKQLYPILGAIARNEPARIGEYMIDFHGQLPQVKSQRESGSLRLIWRTPPKVAFRYVPHSLDPEIESVTLFATVARIQFKWGIREIPLEGLE